MANIAILGAGLLGRLAMLCFNNHNITLYDPKSLNADDHTGVLAAAMLAPTAESVKASANIVNMGTESLGLWQKILINFGWQHCFHQTGSIILAHQADIGAMEQFVLQVSSQQADNLQKLNNDELTQLESELSASFAHSYLIKDEGYIDNDSLYKHINSLIHSSNINVIKHAVSISDKTLDKFDLILDCRGIGAKEECQDILRGVRGEVIRVYAPEVTLTRPIRLMHPRYPIYIVPKSDNQYVIGATEIESESTESITVRSILELLSAAFSVHSGFAEATIVSAKAALRPACTDNEPVINHIGKVIQANGLYRHGFLISPAVIKSIVQIAKQEYKINCHPSLQAIFHSTHKLENKSSRTEACYG